MGWEWKWQLSGNEMLAQNSKQVNHQTRQELFLFKKKYPLPICFTQFKIFSQEKNTLVKCLSNSEDELDHGF